MKNGIKRKRGENKERIYSFLVNYLMENGFAPTVREISMGIGLNSTYSVHRHLQKLEDEGRIQMRRNSPRAIKLVGYELVKMGEANNGQNEEPLQTGKERVKSPCK